MAAEDHVVHADGEHPVDKLERSYLASHGISDETVRKAMAERGLGYVEAVKMLNRERQRRFWSRW